MKSNWIQFFRRPLLKRDRTRLRSPAKFLWRLSELLEEGYAFYDAIYLLLPHHLPNYEEMLEQLDELFREGEAVSVILAKLTIPKSSLLSIIVAEKDGRISSALQVVSKKLARKEEATKKLRNLLAYPLLLFIFITCLLLVFRQSFLPNIQLLAKTRADETILSSLPQLVSRIPDFFIGITILLFLAVFSLRIYYEKSSASTKIQFMLSIPAIGTIFVMQKTIAFGQELGSLLLAGFSLQEALTILEEQEVDVVLGSISQHVRQQVIFGEPFHMAVRLTKGLTEELSVFAKHGEYSGHLPKELLLYCEHLEERLTALLQRALAMLQPMLFGMIAICILAAYLSILLPVYNLLDTM